MTILEKIDQAAKNWNQTKKLQYKMELIILNDGMYYLVPVTKQMLEGISLVDKILINCFDMCDILRLKLTVYSEVLTAYVMNNGSGNFMGCICK